MPMLTDPKYYTATSAQSLYDVCLATYGNVNLLSVLMRDNSITSTSYRPYNGQRFLYDGELVDDQRIEAEVPRYATAAAIYQEKFTAIITESSTANDSLAGFKPLVKETNTNKLIVAQ